MFLSVTTIGKACRGVRIGEQHGLILEVAHDSGFHYTGWHLAHGYLTAGGTSSVPIKKGTPLFNDVE